MFENGVRREYMECLFGCGVMKVDVEVLFKLFDCICVKFVGGYDVDCCRKIGKYIVVTVD